MAAKRPATAVWFAEHSGLVLFAAGCLIVLAAILGPDRGTGAAAAALFVGGAMVLIGALLPRLVGTIRITPASIEVALAERLDATLREAQSRTPGLEEEAVGRAFEELRPRLRTAGLVVADHSTARASPPRPRRAQRVRAAWAALGVLVATAAFTTFMLGSQPANGIAPIVPPTLAALALVLLVVMAPAVMVASALWVLRNVLRSDRSSGGGAGAAGVLAESPRAFARRIVDDLAAEAEMPGSESG